ncbi:hypothetical protein C8035_v010146 [Colletotrichum spinosum]|uniref:Uncharacterized protein n=1 Tax=Colletotrichum spinosum TaxID=1347390 RepID=A0A4R8PZZ3_9PEZI|nr:hypothetical protein C8035_v010146 [Colletotrichum spinosum]
MNNYKDYSYSSKGLNKLILYRSNFTILSSVFKITIVKFNFELLSVDKGISITKVYKIKRIQKDLTPKNKISNNNSKYSKHILEVTYWILLYSKNVYILAFIIIIS